MDGRADALVLAVKEGLAELVGALHLDHAGDLEHRVDVGFLEKPLPHQRVGDGLRTVGGKQRPAEMPQQRAVGLLEAELIRGMKLMGAKSVTDLGRDNLRWRQAPL